MKETRDYQKKIKMFRFFSILFALILFGCNEVNDVQSGITRIRVYRYELVDNKKIDRMVIDTQDSMNIREYLSFMTNISAPFFKCGYTGRMELLKNGGENIEIRFNSGRDCGHYVFSIVDRSFSKRLTAKGIHVLDSIMKARNID